MNKRLRKKKRLGEFRELGFRVWFRHRADSSAGERDALLDAFLAEAVAAHGLSFGGGGWDGVWDGFITLARTRGSATEAHRAVVLAWLANDPRVVAHRAGPLVDAWYGDPFAEVDLAPERA